MQGKEHVPETVMHVTVTVDPNSDRSWLQSKPEVRCACMHASERGTAAVQLPYSFDDEASVGAGCQDVCGRGRVCVRAQVQTDGCHALEAALGPRSAGAEALSEAVKRLKPRVLQRLLDAFKMPQCLVFCRTNHDCDNLEAFLNGLAAGGKGFQVGSWRAQARPGGVRGLFA